MKSIFVLALTVAAQISDEETTQAVTQPVTEPDVDVEVTDPPIDEGPKYCYKCSASIGLEFMRDEGLPCFTPDAGTATIESKGCCWTQYGVVEGHPDQLQYVQRGTDDCSSLKPDCIDMPLNEIDDGNHDNDEEINICDYVCDSVIDGDLCNTNFTTDRPDNNSSRSIGGPLGLIFSLLIGFQ